MSTAIARPEAQLLSVELARDMLAKSKSFDEVKSIRDTAQAVRAYQRSVGAAIEVQQDASEIVVRAKRRMGEMLSTLEKRAGARDGKRGSKLEPRLSDIGVSKKESHRSQRLAALDESSFESYVNSRRAAKKPVTESGALAISTQKKPRPKKKPTAPIPQPESGSRADSQPPDDEWEWDEQAELLGLFGVIRQFVERWPSDRSLMPIASVLGDEAERLHRLDQKRRAQ